ncbi:hypothetical protein [Burkholderia ubonensis]|uniref:hypothetical protein n=1 Tax=Burkholderia ubonensis TaxID=101571 RepID=UPI0021088751|nr:hypothetical protein [Burkholderia ubonensis]
MSDLPRYEKLPLFNPHRKTFTCVYQDQQTPPIDPQAELWFQQALALDNPNIFYKKRDYPKIYQLYTQAADRSAALRETPAVQSAPQDLHLRLPRPASAADRSSGRAVVPASPRAR